MFPTLYHFIYYTLGIEIPFLKAINTFGFFVALAIYAAYITMYTELKRLSLAGKLPKIMVVETLGKPFSIGNYAYQGIFGFIFGYKLVYLFIETQAGKNPQDLIFNLNGNMLYGIIAAILVLAYTFWTDKKQQLPVPKVIETESNASIYMGTITTVALISGFLGAKVFHILENLKEFSLSYIKDNLFSTGGWTFYGGLICGAAGVLIYCRFKKLNVLTILDSGAGAMMISYGIGRFGCHFSGDGDWGVANLATKPFPMPNWLWSYTYPNNVLGMEGFSHEGMKLIPGCKDNFCYELATPVWPTPLYEAVVGIAIFALIWFYLRKLNLGRGVLFAYYMLFAGIERFLVEFIREHGESTYQLGKVQFSQAQLISLLLIVFGLAWILIQKYKTKKTVV